ncbi:MAG: hypothetical protein ABI678_08405 [Kofleriaceae bacterium]
MKVVALALLGSLFGCSDRDKPHALEVDRQPRVLDPPPANVRALPPHAIRADGVGPYRLGLTLEQLGQLVPSGGRNAQVDIPGVVRLSVLHAEEDAIQIGGEPLGRASFVAVVGGTIARTASGIQVGSTRDQLYRALGPPSVELDRARDPAIVVPSNLRELRAVMDGGRIVGLVVAASEPPAKTDGCVRPPDDAKHFGACVTGAPDVVTQDGEELVVRTADGDKQVDKPIRIANPVFVGAVRASDGHDELVAITHTEDAQTQTWSLLAWRYEAGKLVRIRFEHEGIGVYDAPVYTLTATNARWLGSTLRELDLVLEVMNRGDAFEVGGLLTRRSGDKLRDLLVLSPVQVRRRPAKPVTPEPERGSSDAGVAVPAPAPGSDDDH